MNMVDEESEIQPHLELDDVKFFHKSFQVKY